ncbi:MAG: hypothetical protein H7A41_02635 [Chlamydiales bacterium]|nr:hypothetical protein [Chlamydiia bacterium]MCP5504031.1 hypothetical protein [Chlamydiales bacterium]
MKAWTFLLIFLFSPLFALYNGNPSQPDMPEVGIWISNDDWWGIKLGYEWDNTFEKRIKVKERVSSVRERFDCYSTKKNEGVLTFNVSDRFEFYGKLGMMKLDLSQRPINTIKIDYRSDNQFLWGAGGRIILVYWEEMVLGVNALYSGSFMHINKIMENGAPRKTSGARFKYCEWQIGMSVSREIGIFNPYIGVAYSSFNSSLYNIPKDPNYSMTIADEDLEMRDPFILLLGVGLTKGKNVSVNLESRLIGEKAISLTGSVRF